MSKGSICAKYHLNPPKRPTWTHKNHDPDALYGLDSYRASDWLSGSEKGGDWLALVNPAVSLSSACRPPNGKFRKWVHANFLVMTQIIFLL